MAQDSKRLKKVHLKHGEKTNNSNGQSNNNNKITVNKNRTTNQQQQQQNIIRNRPRRIETDKNCLAYYHKHTDINRH